MSDDPKNDAPALAPAEPAEKASALPQDEQARLTDDIGQQLRIRIGVNSGPMLVGNIGSDVRLNYTVIGDTVNVASRLEAQNKTFGTSILIGEATRELLADAFALKLVDTINVRGRSQALCVFELTGARDSAASVDAQSAPQS